MSFPRPKRTLEIFGKLRIEDVYRQKIAILRTFIEQNMDSDECNDRNWLFKGFFFIRNLGRITKFMQYFAA